METRSKPLLGAALSVLFAAAANAGPAATSHTLPLVLAAGGEATGLVRIVNHSDEAGTVELQAIDDEGARFGPVTLYLAAKHAVLLTSRHLEAGDASRGLPEGVGDGEGHWRLTLTSDLDIEPGAYIRTADALNSMHDSVIEDPVVEVGPGRRYQVPFFNPGSNRSRTSLLRIANTSDTTATVEIDGVDDQGESAEGIVRLTLEPLAARTVTAQALETGGAGLAGRLGDGHGKWRLDVSADQPVQVMNLLRSPSGSLTNLSTRTVPEPDLSIHFVGCAAPEGFHGYLARGAREAGNDLGVDLTYVYPEVHTAASQVRLIDDAIAAGADGIAVCAFASDDEYRDVASRARGAGIAFGSAAAPPPGSVMRNPDDPFLFRTGADERAAGALTARRLLAMGVRGRVVILNHLPDDVTCGHRAASQREVLEKHGVKVALVERDMDASQQSYALLAQLQGYPDTTHAATSVCAAPDPLLLVKALTGRDDLVITGYDLLGETLAAIRDGRQAFAIDQQQFWRGYVPVMLLTHYLRYGLQQANYFLTGPSIVDKSNVEQVAALVERGYR